MSWQGGDQLNDPLADRIRAARPVSGNRNMPLTDRAKRDLADLLIAGATAPRRRAPTHHPAGRPRWGPVARLATAVAAVLVAVVAVVPAPTPAYAATPKPLTITALDTPAPDLLHALSMNASRRTDLPPKPTVIQIRSWSLSVTDEGEQLSTVIAPEDYEITFADDGGRTVTVRAGQPVDADGKPATDPASDARPGDVLWSQADAPGTYKGVFAGPAPVDPGAVAAFLAQGISGGSRPGGAEYIQAIASLLFERETSGAQDAAILTFLADRPDIHTVGTVTDRLGRSGIAFRATRATDPDYTDYLVVSPGSGQVLAVETVYTGTTRTDIPSPAVTSYLTWIRTPNT